MLVGHEAARRQSAVFMGEAGHSVLSPEQLTLVSRRRGRWPRAPLPEREAFTLVEIDVIFARAAKAEENFMATRPTRGGELDLAVQLIEQLASMAKSARRSRRRAPVKKTARAK